MDIRSSLAARQIEDRSEWGVNASGAVMLSVPHCLPSPPHGVTLRGGLFTVDYDIGSFCVPVPDYVSPFLAEAPTVLLVTLRRTNIVNERDVFVRRPEPETGD